MTRHGFALLVIAFVIINASLPFGSAQEPSSSLSSSEDIATNENGEEQEMDKCEGEDCVCPPGYEGIEPHCMPILLAPTAPTAPKEDAPAGKFEEPPPIDSHDHGADHDHHGTSDNHGAPHEHQHVDHSSHSHHHGDAKKHDHESDPDEDADAGPVAFAAPAHGAHMSPPMTEVLTTMTVAVGDAFTISCFSREERFRDFEPVLKYRKSENDDFVNIFIGAAHRPDIPPAIISSVTPEKQDHLFHYNFRSATLGVGGEYECDYTAGDDDLVYRVVVLDPEGLRCPAAGDRKDLEQIPSVTCSIPFQGFVETAKQIGAVLQIATPGFGVVDIGDLQVDEFGQGRLDVVKEEFLVFRKLDGANFRCVFPLTSSPNGLTCDSPPFEVTWPPSRLNLEAPGQIVAGVEEEFRCSVEDVGNPPTQIDIRVGDVGEKGAIRDSNSTSSAPATSIRYTETRRVDSVNVSCSSSAHRLHILVNVLYGPDEVRSQLADEEWAVVLEHAPFEWECFAGPSRPPAMLDYFLCGAADDDVDDCETLDHDGQLFAKKTWRHKFLKCSATNPETGKRVESVAHKIDVHHPPQYLGDADDQFVSPRLGEGFSLDCEHEANPEKIVYQWEKKVEEEEEEEVKEVMRRRRRRSWWGAEGEKRRKREQGEKEEEDEDEEATPPALVNEENDVKTTMPKVEDVEDEDAGKDDDDAALEEEVEGAVETTPGPVVEENDADDADNSSSSSSSTDAASSNQGYALPAAPRPLLPSVDLSGHDAATFVVDAAERRHFGVYVCGAGNEIGKHRVVFRVEENTKPKPEPTKKSGWGGGGKGGGNGAGRTAGGLMSVAVAAVVGAAVGKWTAGRW